MTTETLNISEAQLVEYSQAHNEPSWLTDLRKEALKLTETLEMPRPDKTKIKRWDFDSFQQLETTGGAYETLEEFPDSIKRIIDVDGSENLVIQHNNSTAFTRLSESAKNDGVIVEGLAEALVNHPDLVKSI